MSLDYRRQRLLRKQQQDAKDSHSYSTYHSKAESGDYPFGIPVAKDVTIKSILIHCDDIPEKRNLFTISLYFRDNLVGSGYTFNRIGNCRIKDFKPSESDYLYFKLEGPEEAKLNRLWLLHTEEYSNGE